MNAAELSSLKMRQCARCHCVFPLDAFYVRAGKPDSYCRPCRRLVNGPREVDPVVYHHRGSIAYPTATRRCKHCGRAYADFRVLWHDERTCVFCASDGAK